MCVPHRSLQRGRACSRAESVLPEADFEKLEQLQRGRACSRAERSALGSGGVGRGGLQRGRACSRAESAERRIAAAVSKRLQRGRACSRAERSHYRVDKIEQKWLQRGRACSRAERHEARHAATERTGLQRGRACSRAERRPRCRSCPSTGRFNGAARVRARRGGQQELAVLRLGGFNGAARVRARRGRTRRAPFPRSLGFNGAARVRARRGLGGIHQESQCFAPPSSSGTRICHASLPVQEGLSAQEPRMTSKSSCERDIRCRLPPPRSRRAIRFSTSTSRESIRSRRRRPPGVSRNRSWRLPWRPDPRWARGR